MTYALIENGVVTNIITLSPNNAHEFPNAVNIDDCPVQIGDTYEDGRFYRNGIDVLVYEEFAAEAAQQALLTQMEVAYREGVNSA